jgi:hypothetical protein
MRSSGGKRSAVVFRELFGEPTVSNDIISGVRLNRADLRGVFGGAESVDTTKILDA